MLNVVGQAAPMNDYGARAHADLIVTRGAGFRKEKNKKKRGSYRGGEITVSFFAFQFPFSSPWSSDFLVACVPARPCSHVVAFCSHPSSP